MKKIFTQQIALYLCLIGFSCLSNTYLGAMPVIRPEAGTITATVADPATAPVSISVSKPLADPDSVAVFHQCLNLAGLQAFLDKNANGSYKQLNVLIHSIPFPQDGSVMHNGTAVRQVAKGDVKSDKTISYFYFHEFKIDGSSAYVDYIYNYDQSSANPKLQVIHLDLKKTGSDWSIINTKMEAR